MWNYKQEKIAQKVTEIDAYKNVHLKMTQPQTVAIFFKKNMATFQRDISSPHTMTSVDITKRILKMNSKQHNFFKCWRK
jgi:hypothetical protein